MEQLNNVLPTKEEAQSAAVKAPVNNTDSPLLDKVRRKFGFFAGISLIFGIGFAFFFYKTGIGFNVLAFTAVMVVLLYFVMKKLELPMKKATIAYYLGALSLGLSSMLTENDTLQFINLVGILILLDLSILHQINEDHRWDVSMHIFKMFGLFFSGIASIWMPFAHSLDFLKNKKFFKTERSWNILLGILFSIPLLMIIVALLSSADLLFGRMTKDIFVFLFSSSIVNVTVMILFGCLSCYCIICGAVRRQMLTKNELIEKKADPAIAVTVMSLIGAVYVIFCSIQVIYLFANGFFSLPEEFTFAEYARRGFFELLAVTVINIILILICTAAFRENKILKGILTLITVGTYIMIASAAYRMFLYIGAYHLTFLRLFVLLFLLIDALVLAGIIISVYNRKFPVFGYCITVGVICYLVFSLSRPDYFIADYLLEKQETLKTEDIVFLTNELSLDAAPAVLPYLSGIENYNDIIPEQTENAQYTQWNSADSYAKEYYNRINRAAKANGIRDYNISVRTASDYANDFPMK